MKTRLRIVLVAFFISAVAFTVIAIVLTTDKKSTLYPQNTKYTYADWATCGISPWSVQEDFEKCFGSTQWLATNGTNNITAGISSTWWESSAKYGFGNVGYGANTDGTARQIYISVLKNSKLVSLPRGIDIGTKIDDLYRIYALTNKNENGYFYGDENTFPNAQQSTRFIITLQDVIKDINDAEVEWLCDCEYSIDNDKVISINLSAHQMPYSSPQLVSIFNQHEMLAYSS